jgi:hypothetical protein
MAVLRAEPFQSAPFFVGFRVKLGGISGVGSLLRHTRILFLHLPENLFVLIIVVSGTLALRSVMP